MGEWLRPRSEDGMTLNELMISMMVISIVLTIVTILLIGVQKVYVTENDRTQTNNQARLAVEELDREIRSGNVLYDPALENDPAHDIYPGMAFRIYSQSNADSRPGFRCVQWRINSSGQLQNRFWSTNWRDDPSILVSGWRIIADHVVNRSDSPQIPAFAVDTSDPSYGNRLLKITLVVNQNPKSGRDVTIQSSIEGRDTTFGYPNSACADIPPY
jgi:type II secretory pathway pseudopilin PulG